MKKIRLIGLAISTIYNNSYCLIIIIIIIIIIVGVKGQGTHIYVYIGLGAQSEDVKQFEEG